MSTALRSGIFCSAIWRTWALVTDPDFSRGVSDEPFSMPAACLQQERGRRRLGDERERPVLEDRDLGRDDLAPLALGLLVVGLAEVHDVDAVRAERRTHRRCRGRLSRRDLDLHDRCQLLLRHLSCSVRLLDLRCSLGSCGAVPAHSRCSPRLRGSSSAGHCHSDARRRLAGSVVSALTRPAHRLRGLGQRSGCPCLGLSPTAWLTWPNSSSTGVSRPKMFTRTLSFERSTSISLIAPLKSANGPATTLTCSPSSYSRRGRAFFSGRAFRLAADAEGLLDLLAGERGGLGAAADEAGDTRACCARRTRTRRRGPCGSAGSRATPSSGRRPCGRS